MPVRVTLNQPVFHEQQLQLQSCFSSGREKVVFLFFFVFQFNFIILLDELLD